MQTCSRSSVFVVNASHLERMGTHRSFLIVPTHQLNIPSVKIEAMDVRFYQQFRILSNGTTHLHNEADVEFLKILQLGSVYVLFSARQITECWGLPKTCSVNQPTCSTEMVNFSVNKALRVGCILFLIS